mgnify:CR=1 FL=1
MKRYQVKIIVRNVFEIEAENAEDAEAQVKELGVHETLEHCDLEIEDVRESEPAFDVETRRAREEMESGNEKTEYPFDGGEMA